MKKILLSLFLLAGAAGAARAQGSLINATVAGFNLGRTLHNKNKQPVAKPVEKEKKDKSEKADRADKENATIGSYQGKNFPMQRTPADQLPKKGAEQVTALETQLDRCHAALLANDQSALFTPEQRTSLQQAMVGAARVQSDKMMAYQQEAAFYLAEDARRQQAAAPAAPTN